MSISFHYPPVGAPSIDRQMYSAVTADGTPVAVAKTEADGDEAITLFIAGGSSVRCERLSPKDGAKPHRAHLTCGASGCCHVVWNACRDGEWQVLLRSFDTVASCVEGTPAVVRCSRNAIFPPAVAENGNTLCVVWAEETDGCFRIHASHRALSGGDWSAPKALSADDTDALRPCIAPVKGGWLIAWDRYADGQYAIQYAIFDGKRGPDISTLSHEGERWFMPRCVSDGADRAYLAWVSVSLVRDEALGIYDQQTAGLCAAIEAGEARLLEDVDSSWDSRFPADLREGFLATKHHNGHHGIRRNLQPCLWNDRLWLCWELRKEMGKDGRIQGQTCGILVGRAWENGAWSPARLIHSEMLSYSPANRLDGKNVPVWFVDFHGNDAHVPRFDTVALDDLDVFAQRDAGEWARWKPTPRPVVSPRRESVALRDESMDLFWADTHCHSVLSADAEGELDELVAFGRDIAGLDIMAIVDNDYYPCKALTGAEWEALQATARHCTQDGRFILFPAYEYTYHRKSLVERNGSNFNHRYVMYPPTGGPLVRRINVGGASDAALMQTLKNTDALLVAHHNTWELLDPDLDHTVEVCSSWRICIEECDFILRQLKAGVKFGFVGSSDSHRMIPGLGGALTGVFAKELTPNAVLDAYRKRRLIATTGCRMLIDFQVADLFIGEEGQVEGPPRVTGKVRAPREIEQVTVIRDGEVIRQLTPAADSVDIDFTDDAAIGLHFYFVKVKLVGDPSYNIGTEDLQDYRPFQQEGRYPGNWGRADGCFGWSSPIWLERTS